MTSNIGPANITPAPSIHNVLLRDSGAPNPLDPKFFEETGTVLLELFLAQVALALGNVTILGIKPFAFLTTWGENLETLATDAFSGQQTANNNLAALVDAVLGTGHTFEDLGAAITSGLSGVEGLLSAALDNLDGTAEAWASFLFNGDGTATIEGAISDAEAAVQDFFDGTAQWVSGLLFNSDGTASYGPVLGFHPLRTLIDQLDGTAMAAGAALHNLLNPQGVHTTFTLPSWRDLFANTGLGSGGQLANALKGLLPAALDNLDGTAETLANIVHNFDGTATALTQAASNALTGLVDNFDGTVMSWAHALQSISVGQNIATALSTGQQVGDALANALGHPGTGHTPLQILSYLAEIPAALVAGVTTEEQNLRDAIANAMGHAGTGHTAADILGYLGAIPATVISGILSTLNIPNITLAMSTDMQGITNAIYNAINNAAATGKTVADALAALGSIFTGFFNAFTGQSVTSASVTDASGAVAGAAANTAANAAQINAAQTVFAPLPYGSIAVTNQTWDFSTFSNNSSAITGFTMTQPTAGHGTLGIVNGVAAFTPGGTTSWSGWASPTSVSTVTDNQLSSASFPKLITSDTGTLALVFGRYKDANNFVAAFIGLTSIQVTTYVSGSSIAIGSAITHTYQPGALYTLQCGMASGTRHFDVLCNGASLTAGVGVNDVGASSQIGATFRGGAFGMNAPTVSGSQVGAVTISRYSLADNVSLLTAPSAPDSTVNTAAAVGTASTTYAALSNSPSVTVVVGSSGKVALGFESEMSYSSGTNVQSWTSFAASGNNTIAAADTAATHAHFQSSVAFFGAGWFRVLTGLTAGSTTFQLKGRVNTGNVTFGPWSISAIPL